MKDYSYINLVLGFVFTLTLWIPVIGGYRIPKLSETKLASSVLAESCHGNYVALFVSSIPFLLDTILDYKKLFDPYKRSVYIFFQCLTSMANFCLSLQLVLLKSTPSFLHFTTDPTMTYILIIYTFRLLGSTSLLYYLQQSKRKWLPGQIIFILTLLACISILLRFYSIGTSHQVFYIVANYFTAFMSFIFTCSSLYLLRLIYKYYHELNDQDYAALLYLLCLIALGASAFTNYFQYIQEGHAVNDVTISSPRHIQVFITVYTAYCIILTIIPGRVARMESETYLNGIIDAKKAFIRFVSHELRTPLNTVFLGLNLSLDQIPEYSTNLLDIERRETLCETITACGAALDILNELLIYDKLENGVLIAHKSIVLISDLIYDSLLMFSVHIRDKNISMTIINNHIERSALSTNDTYFQQNGRNCNQGNTDMSSNSSNHVIIPPLNLSDSSSHMMLYTTSDYNNTFTILPSSPLHTTGTCTANETTTILHDNTTMNGIQKHHDHVHIHLSKEVTLRTPFYSTATTTTNLEAAIQSPDSSSNIITYDNKTSIDNSNMNEMKSDHSSMNHQEHTNKTIGNTVNSSLDQIQFIYDNDVIYVDKNKITQVIRNVISNAIKFTPVNGAITISIKYEPHGNIGITESHHIQTDHYHPNQSHILPTSTYDAQINTNNTTTINSDNNKSNKWFNPISYIKELSANFTSVTNQHTTTTTSTTATTTTTSNDKYNSKRMDSDSHNHHKLDSDTIGSSSSEGYLVIEVTDTGAGISEENQQKLFREIVQFHPEILQNGGGSGLGMWISKGILNLHHGEISVYSGGEGLGSTFTIKLPMTRHQTTTTDDSTNATVTAAAANISRNNQTILNMEKCNNIFKKSIPMKKKLPSPINTTTTTTSDNNTMGNMMTITTTTIDDDRISPHISPIDHQFIHTHTQSHSHSPNHSPSYQSTPIHDTLKLSTLLYNDPYEDYLDELDEMDIHQHTMMDITHPIHNTDTPRSKLSLMTSRTDPLHAHPTLSSKLPPILINLRPLSGRSSNYSGNSNKSFHSQYSSSSNNSTTAAAVIGQNVCNSAHCMTKITPRLLSFNPSSNTSDSFHMIHTARSYGRTQPSHDNNTNANTSNTTATTTSAALHIKSESTKRLSASFSVMYDRLTRYSHNSSVSNSNTSSSKKPILQSTSHNNSPSIRHPGQLNNPIVNPHIENDSFYLTPNPIENTSSILPLHDIHHPTTTTHIVSLNSSMPSSQSTPINSIRLKHLPKHLLVVDDSSMNRKMICRLLHSLGYVCTEACDGLEAVQYITQSFLHQSPPTKTYNTLINTNISSNEQKSDHIGKNQEKGLSTHNQLLSTENTLEVLSADRTSSSSIITNIITYDAILMDFMMPNMDGPTATAEIRKLGYIGPIIGVTGNGMKHDVDLFLAQGANKILIKPVMKEMIARALLG